MSAKRKECTCYVAGLDPFYGASCPVHGDEAEALKEARTRSRRKLSTYASGVRTEDVARERDWLGKAWGRIATLVEGLEPHIDDDDCDFRSGFYRLPSGNPMTREALAKQLESLACIAAAAARVARKGADDEAAAETERLQRRRDRLLDKKRVRPSASIGHSLTGNCWHRKRSDVCREHDEPRGDCAQCGRCPACDRDGAERGS